jgi:hypothetical protein
MVTGEEVFGWSIVNIKNQTDNPRICGLSVFIFILTDAYLGQQTALTVSVSVTAELPLLQVTVTVSKYCPPTLVPVILQIASVRGPES